MGDLVFEYAIVRDKGTSQEFREWFHWNCRDLPEVLEAVTACLDESYMIDFSPLPPRYYDAVRLTISRINYHVF